MKLPKQSASVDAAYAKVNSPASMVGESSIFPSFFNGADLDKCYSQCGVSKETCDNDFKSTVRSICSMRFPNRQDVANRMACQRMAEFFTDSSEGAYQAAQRRCETEVAR
uniref:hypothetical protein n=1 Tax=Candidatus Electronema sp. TaxID=2698783 RepID=UPI004056EA7C